MFLINIGISREWIWVNIWTSFASPLQVPFQQTAFHFNSNYGEVSSMLMQTLLKLQHLGREATKAPLPQASLQCNYCCSIQW